MFLLFVPQVYTLVLEGRFTEARELLKNNSNYEYDTRNVRNIGYVCVYLSVVCAYVCVHV